eukprot:TRINITY_DN4205_c0_g2_i1.p1 TRINITY_DN4205_c0_g2~~TRINITY_DN4205_c0_g2_i1.p1  ORF type:complete len:339 (-),score=81.68 TRINITY_DN4205_c0_g2_i1:546-1562(-)
MGCQQGKIVVPKEQKKTKHRLLLLGAGEAGKSTIFKQIKVIKQNGFTNEERMDFAHRFFAIIVEHINKIINECSADDLEDIKDVVDLLQHSNPSSAMSLLERKDIVKRVWANGAIQSKFHELNLPKESSSYYLFSNLDRMCDASFVPSDQDILHFRSPTNQITDIVYPASDFVDFSFIDVGGQRSERIHWSSVGDVTAVIFVAALDDFAKVLDEDNTRNRMVESLLLFRMIASKHFAEKPVILFLNKKDIMVKRSMEPGFGQTMQTVFSDFDPEGDYKYAVKFLEKKFRSVLVGRRDDLVQKLVVYRTCATETDQMEKIFKAVEKIVFDINIDDNLLD